MRQWEAGTLTEEVLVVMQIGIILMEGNLAIANKNTRIHHFFFFKLKSCRAGKKEKTLERDPSRQLGGQVSHLPFDPGVSLLGIYPADTPPTIHMYRVTLCHIVCNCKLLESI